jgi:hypothetical protein
MCTLHDLAQPTTLARSATKIMQLNMKRGNKKYGETEYTYKQVGYQNHATLDIR